MIREIALQYEFPEEAADFLQQSFMQLLKAPHVSEDLELAEKLFFKKYYGYKEILKRLAEATDVNLYTAQMIFMLLASRKLHEMYKKANIEDAVFLETMQDLKYKLFECMNMHGVWGTFVPDWFMHIYTMQCFKLGRLEYQRSVATEKEEQDGICKAGDLIYHIHIPSSGPLHEEEVLNSLQAAKTFFKEELKDGKFIVLCGSWLLYPPLIEKLRDTSNIKKFYKLFTIRHTEERPENGDFWRIFYEPYSEEAITRITPKGHLQETVIRHLKTGGTIGIGRGYIIVE